MIKVLISLERKRRASEVAERILGDFAYTDEEWEYVHQNQFVDDSRGRKLFDKHLGIISWSGQRAARSARRIRFSDQYIYLFGDGEQKVFKIQSLNPGGTDIRLQSIRILDLQPLRKLQVKVSVSLLLEHQRVDFDIEYLIPTPISADSRLAEIEREYGELILSS